VNHQLKHGYTLADLHTIARLAVHTAGAAASDWHERYDTAYSGIAEALYAAEYWPQRHQLVRAGQLAIYATVDGHMQAHGYYRRKTDGTTHGAGSSPAWRAYWLDLTRPTRSPEGRVVEHAALAQILARLAPRHQDALLALAVHDDYRTAAAALGLGYATFCDHIAKARRHFYRLWHEGEKPSRIWGTDRRSGSTSDVKSARVRGTAGHLAARRRRATHARRDTPTEAA
jgi:hypothetical protein